MHRRTRTHIVAMKISSPFLRGIHARDPRSLLFHPCEQLRGLHDRGRDRIQLASNGPQISCSPDMDFYYISPSAPCRSVMLTAKALNIELNKKVLDLMKGEQMAPEFVAINPQHCVPTLVDGDFTLWESRAICTYLIHKYGKDADSLYPKDPVTRALIDRLLYFDMGTLYKRFGEYVYPVIFGNDVKPDPEKLTALQECLKWLEDFLVGHDFCVGNNLTVADFCVVATVSTIKEAGIDLSSYSNVTAWLKRCESKMIGYETENLVGAKMFGGFFTSKLSA